MTRIGTLLISGLVVAGCNTGPGVSTTTASGDADWDALVTNFETNGAPLGTTDPSAMTSGIAGYIGMFHGEVEDPKMAIKANVYGQLALTYDLDQVDRPMTSGKAYNVRTDLPGFENPMGEIIFVNGGLDVVDGGTALQPGFGAGNAQFTQGAETLILDLDSDYSGDYIYGPIGNWAEGEVTIDLYDNGGASTYTGLHADTDGRWIAQRD